LHVLQVSDQTTAAPDGAVALSAPDATGVLVGDWVVWFGARGGISGLSYELDAGRSTQVVVGDLAPRTAYQIQVGADIFTESSDEHGVLTFYDDRADQHTVSLGQGVCPDADGDGYLDVACGGTDCADADPAVYPGATEICDNGRDDDCDGLIDQADLGDCGGLDGGSDAGDAGLDGSADGGDIAVADDDGVFDGDGESNLADATQPDKVTGGCGCSGPAGGAGLGCWCLLGLGWLVARRRRR
jgi:uncharacterized protein (TIGR03382 family)